jgi:hypothetical protein
MIKSQAKEKGKERGRREGGEEGEKRKIFRLRRLKGKTR